MIALDFSAVTLQIRSAGTDTTVFDPIRKKWVALTPEEHVRQFLIAYLAEQMQYPTGLLSVEKMIQVATRKKRFDLVVFNRSHQPWMLAECKAPSVEITNKTLFQLLDYHSAIPCRYWLLTNGHQTFCADAADPSQINWLPALPSFDS